MRFRAILDRLDDLESRLTTAGNHTSPGGSMRGRPQHEEEEHAPFSKNFDILEGATNRGIRMVFSSK